MNIYEIDRRIEELIAASVDEETGELLLDDAELDALQMERDAKVEGLALYIKNLSAFAAGVRQEELVLAERRKSAERKAERLTRYLSDALDGERFTTERVACTFRKSESVDLAPEFIVWACQYREDLLRYKQPEADKTAIKKLLKSGEELPGAELVSKMSLTIK